MEAVEEEVGVVGEAVAVEEGVVVLHVEHLVQQPHAVILAE